MKGECQHTETNFPKYLLVTRYLLKIYTMHSKGFFPDTLHLFGKEIGTPT